MGRVRLYSDIDNIAEIFRLDRESSIFHGMKHFLSRECAITFCETENVGIQNVLFESIANELTTSNFEVSFRDEDETFLDPPFKTNLQEHFTDLSTIFFSYDNERINLARSRSGILMAGIGEEIELYNKINYFEETYTANTILTIGKSFNDYKDLSKYILPFSEIIINEPYLFKPDRNDWDLKSYIDKNTRPFFDTLFSNIDHKVNVVIGTFVNEQIENQFNFFSAESGFKPLYDLCLEILSASMDPAKFKLWLCISPQARKGRHDRYILTNYQFVDSPSGFTFFDDRGNFVNRGESIHLYTIGRSQFRNETMPSIIENFQNKVIDSTMQTHPNRIFGKDQGNTQFLKFE
jgi:hypothetical protein